ncbi:ras association domain-containing protein 3 isoform X2 [Tachysurus ichikawai]
METGDDRYRNHVPLKANYNGKDVQNCDSKDVEKEKDLRTHLSYEEIKHNIELYNAATRDHFKMTLLSETEHPLLLRLLAGPNLDTLSFVLREQQTGEVMWDAFSIPELCNFLRILEKEEQDQVRVITARYNIYREKLEQALRATSSHN